MLRRTYEQQNCSVAWALELVGERWTFLIVRDALLGVSRFGIFRQRLGIAANVLAARLDRLVDHGIFERLPYQERPTRYEYRLTPCGQELGLVVLALMKWGDRHLAGADGPPRTAHHHGCGGAIDVQLVCTSCGQDVAPAHVTTRPATRPSPLPP